MNKVLVTGADGFIGSHLVEKLLNEGCHVRALVFYNSFNSWGWLDTLSAEITNNIEVYSGDIRDRGFVMKATRDIQCVFHLAALVSIPFSYQAPQSYVDTNIGGTLNILQSSLENEVERVLVTSTSEVYGTAKYVPMDENHPLQAQSPYSASKIGADRLAESYYRTFELPVTIVRPFNTYGPRQSARAIIPTIITQLLTGKREIKLGNLEATRDFTFVSDTCQGFIDISHCLETVSEEINLGNGQEISIGNLAQMLIEIINPSAVIIQDDQRFRPEKSEVDRLLADTNKVYRLSGWKPRYSLRDGLETTIEWIKTNLSRYKADKYNI
jgi:NAD dependent epimerase/dehydratase